MSRKSLLQFQKNILFISIYLDSFPDNRLSMLFPSGCSFASALGWKHGMVLTVMKCTRIIIIL